MEAVSFESQCDHWVELRRSIGRKKAESNPYEARESAREHDGSRVDEHRPSAISGNERRRDCSCCRPRIPPSRAIATASMRN